MKAEEQKREKYLPTLLIQQIRLQWYKDCRGGNAAAQRNQYPRAMRLPKDFFSYYPFGLPTHFASIIQRPDGFQIDRDCRRPVSYTHLIQVLEQAGITVDKFGGEAFRAAVSDGQAELAKLLLEKGCLLYTSRCV